MSTLGYRSILYHVCKARIGFLITLLTLGLESYSMESVNRDLPARGNTEELKGLSALAPASSARAVGLAPPSPKAALAVPAEEEGISLLSLFALLAGLCFMAFLTAVFQCARSNSRIVSLSRALETRRGTPRQRESALPLAAQPETSSTEGDRTHAFPLSWGIDELRGPLQGIVRAARGLDKADLGPDQRHALESLRASALGLARLYEKLLEEREASSGGAYAPTPSHFTLHDLIDLVEPLFHGQPGDSWPALSVEAEGGNRRFFADLDGLAQLIVAMADESSAEECAVAVRLYPEDRNLKILVSTAPLGASCPLRRGDVGAFRAEDRDSSGGGTRASRVNSLVERMGGVLQAQGAGEGGSARSVVLPLPSVPIPEDPSFPARGAVPAPVTAAPRGPFAGLKVLLAEDEAINRLYMTRVLSAAGMLATATKDGEAALEAYLSAPGRWDLLLMDMTMPRLDGTETARRVRDLEASRGMRRVPIIAMTAHSTSDDRSSYLQAGMDGFLAKPFVERAFWAEISRVLGPCSAQDLGWARPREV